MRVYENEYKEKKKEYMVVVHYKDVRHGTGPQRLPRRQYVILIFYLLIYAQVIIFDKYY